MKAGTKRLLAAIAALQPPLTGAALAAALKEAHLLAESGKLVAVSASGAANQASNPLEELVKRRLRQFSGRTSNFLPFLENRANERGAGLRFTSKTSLSIAIASVELKLGNDAPEVIEAALDAYVELYNSSYRLKKA